MKIAILTFHNAHNYGAILQAYALRKYLRDLGHDVNILNYRNEAIESNYVGDLPYRYTLKDLKHIRRIPIMLLSNFYTMLSRKYWRRRCKNFNDFIDSIILENDLKVLTCEDVSDFECDAYIAGSDQIWNIWLTRGADPVYFLDFETDAKKIFYAGSNGSSEIPVQALEQFKKSMNDSTMISVREKSLGESIKTACCVNTESVIDPTLLLDEYQYKELIHPVECKEDYLMAYFITEDPKMHEIAGFIARALNLKLVEFHGRYNPNLKGCVQCTDKAPGEFLSYIKNAKFVVTNSFHGTVFSILFSKKFYSVYNEDSRKSDLLSDLGLSSRHIYDYKEIDLNEDIDYSEVYLKLDKLRTVSKKFLKDSVG